MKTVNKQALVPYTPAQMYALVNDVADYQNFLPWCSFSEVLESDEESMRARVELSLKGMNKAFVTLNRLQRDKMIEMRLLEGPFKTLEGFWRFDPLGETGCKISLDLEYEFSNPMLGMMIGPIFSQVANTLVDAFSKRAVEIYGKR